MAAVSEPVLSVSGARRLTLDFLTTAEARALLTSYLGQSRVDAEPDAVAELIERCAHLPLALSVVAARAAGSPTFPLSALVDELRHEQDRLDALDFGDDTGVRAVFSWSYRTLSAEAARMFRLLGLPAGADISLGAAAALAGLPERRARPLLDELGGRRTLWSTTALVAIGSTTSCGPTPPNAPKRTTCEWLPCERPPSR